MKLLLHIKKIVPLALLLMYFLELQNVLGQDKAVMTDYLKHRFQIYCQLVKREEVFVSSDREEYMSGEVLWFNAWLMDRQSSTLSSESKICYVELLNPDNIPVIQKRIRIDNCFGRGQLELSDTLPTGTYTLRAYTNWMKNFLPNNCFMKDIKIFNSFKARSFKNREFINEELKPRSGIDSIILKTRSLLNLTANNLKSDTLEIIVNADEKYLSESNNVFYLFIQTHGNINHVSLVKIIDRQTKISLQKSLLMPGINQITIFDFKGQPVCERYIYTPNNLKKAFSIRSADSCGTRSKVTLEFKIDDSIYTGLNSTDFSISVAPMTSSKRGMELSEYMIFGSEYGLLPGRIMNGRKIDEMPRELIDSLLGNIRSSWIDWQPILADTQPEFKNKVEKEDHFLSGLLLTNEDQLANPGETLLLSTPGKVASFQYAATNYEAGFSFNIPIGEEVRDLIIQPDDTIKNNEIYIESSFSGKYVSSLTWIDSTGKSLPPYISDWSINYQVSKIYGSSSLGEPSFYFSVPPLHIKRFYGKPDAEILMKDWSKLSTMEEVFFEIVPHFKLKKKGSVYEMVLSDPFGKILYDKPPVMMIDGVVIKDPAIIANLNPDEVEKIDVVKGQYMAGDYLFNGVVNVITKSGDFSGIPVPDYSIRMQYRIFDSGAEFLSPDYSASEMKNSTEPDFRNTLYWNPSIKPDKDGKIRVEFWTSDIHSDYEINIQGITPEGKTISLKKAIKVK